MGKDIPASTKQVPQAKKKFHTIVIQKPDILLLWLAEEMNKTFNIKENNQHYPLN